MGPALRRNNDAVPNLAMSGDTHLPGENRILPNLSGSRQPNLRAQQSVITHDRAMSNLNDIVDLHAIANARFPDAGAVNA